VHHPIMQVALTLGMINGYLMVRLWRERKKPKPPLSGQFPWCDWRRDSAILAGILVLSAVAGYSAADLAFTAILLFGGYDLNVVLTWLRDRHAIRQGAVSGR
jgi:hypothetical protein